MTVKIVALLTSRPGQAPALEALLIGMAPACRAEPGNLAWEIWRDRAQPGRFVLNELYRDDLGVAAHRRTPHFQAYLARIGELAERESLVLDPVGSEMPGDEYAG